MTGMTFLSRRRQGMTIPYDQLLARVPRRPLTYFLFWWRPLYRPPLRTVNAIGFHGFPYGKLWKTMSKSRTKLNESFET